MSGKVISRVSGLPMAPREIGRNPRLHNCAPHLRRCCGVCVHFDGAVIRTTARCAMLGGDRSGLLDAAGCAHWARKSAGGDA